MSEKKIRKQAWMALAGRFRAFFFANVRFRRYHQQALNKFPLSFQEILACNMATSLGAGL